MGRAEENPFIVNGILYEGSFPETFTFRMNVRDAPNGGLTSQYFDLFPVYMAEVTQDEQQFVFVQELDKSDFPVNCSQSFRTENDGVVQTIHCVTRLNNGALLDTVYLWYEKGGTISFGNITDYKHVVSKDAFKWTLTITDWSFQNKTNKIHLKIRFYSSEPLADNGIPYPQPDALAWNTNLFSKGPIGGGVNLTVLTFADVDGEQTFYRRSSFELPGLVDGTETWDDLHTYDNVIEFDSFESYLDFDPGTTTPEFRLMSILLREEEDGEDEEQDFGGLGTGGLAALVTPLVVLAGILIIGALLLFVFYRKKHATLPQASGGAVAFDGTELSPSMDEDD
ncbi:hypothetical protein QOT17_009219 [Balamuthia mandrillaris]